MILGKVNSPQDLKNLSLNEQKQLCAEVRSLIIEVVSQKGGHLASSLGAVELCIGLHYCLKSPEDTIIFDVGHQSYAHKIITGRRDAFRGLREYQGLSGFPNYQESLHDVYTSGHASTALSWAQGISEAKKLKSDNSKTVAVIGDGTLTGGMCFEALNNCGHTQSDVLIVFNHNEMSISPSVGALSNYLTKIISAPIYNRIREGLIGAISQFSLGKRISQHARKIEETLKGLVVPGIFFEELGFRYFGPIDGHNLEALIPALKNVLALKGPRLLHVVTKKGKGYKFSEENAEDFHSAPSFDKENGVSLKKAKISYSQAFGKKLISLAQKDKRIVAITAAMLKGTGLDLFKEEFPERFFDVGIAEAHAVGFASGLAKQGLKPVVAIYSTFLQRSFDQIIHDVALQNLPVVFAIDRAGLVGEDGPTHHGVFDLGYLRLIPNLICMAPKDKEELEEMLEFALKLNSAVSIRYPKGGVASLGSTEKVKLAKAEIIREGKDFCLITLGSMAEVGIKCADLLGEEDITTFLVNARFIKPLDEELLRHAADTFKLIVTLEEGSLACGFGSAVLEFYEKEGCLNKLKLIRAGLPSEFIPHGSREILLRLYGIDASSLAHRIKAALKKEAICHR